LWARATRSRVFEPGQTFFLEGDECRGVYCIQSGLVGLRRSDEDGNSALLRLSQRGDILGYRALLGKGRHRNTAEVLTHCRACFIEASQLVGLIERNPALREGFLQRALADFNRTEDGCAALMTAGLRSRLLKLLQMLREGYGAESGDQGYQLDLPLQRKDIAALLGATPESISRLISKLGGEGLVKFKGRQVFFPAATATVRLGPASSRVAAVGPANDAIKALMEARGALLSMIAAKEKASKDALHTRVRLASANLDALLARMTGSDDNAAAFKAIWKQFKVTRQNEIIPAIYAGRTDIAKKIATGIQAERLAKMKEILSARYSGVQEQQLHSPC